MNQPELSFKQLILAYMTEGLTQSEIADKLHLKRETINRKIKKEGIMWRSSNHPVSDPKSDHTLDKITEEVYEAYLLKCIRGEGDIRICTEIRNYLDKTEQLSKGKKDEVAFDLSELMT